MSAGTPIEVIIAGGGPGGLCAALALSQRGVPVVVVERASKRALFSDVGGGYDISPHTLAMLDRAGCCAS